MTEQEKKIADIVLDYLGKNPKSKVADISTATDLHSTIVGRALSTLHSAGVVHKERGRDKKLYFTKADLDGKVVEGKGEVITDEVLQLLRKEIAELKAQVYNKPAHTNQQGTVLEHINKRKPIDVRDIPNDDILSEEEAVVFFS